MYLQLKIENFRGIRSLTLERLARVNLLVGANSVGKTSVLEAIWLLRGAGNPSLPINLAGKRGTQPVLMNAPDSHWLTLFRNLDPRIPVEVSGSHGSQTHESLRLQVKPGSSETIFPENGNGKGFEVSVSSPLGTTETLPISFQMIFESSQSTPVTSTMEISNENVQESGNPAVTRPALLLPARNWSSLSEIAERFSLCEDQDRVSEIIDAIRIVEPELEDISLGFSSVGNRPILYMKTANMPRRLPFDISGGGGRRLLELLVSILPESGSPVMIDEFENGIYYANLERAWKAIDRASQTSGCQLFVTTHSLECIHAAVSAFQFEHPDDLRIFRLEARNGETRVVDYDFDVALAATEANLEMR